MCQDLNDEREAAESALLLRFGALVAILTAASLRGHEGFYLDIAATKAHLKDVKNGALPKKFSRHRVLSEDEILAVSTVCICLMGKFKGKTGERYHSIILANESMSGLTVRWWVEAMISLCDEEGKSKGFAFDKTDDTPPDSAEYNALFCQYLQKLQENHQDLFSAKEDVTRYGIRRSLQKSAVTRAGKAGMMEMEVSAVNRWRTVEKTNGSLPKHNMLTHYTDAGALVPMTWKYSYVL